MHRKIHRQFIKGRRKLQLVLSPLPNVLHMQIAEDEALDGQAVPLVKNLAQVQRQQHRGRAPGRWGWAVEASVGQPSRGRDRADTTASDVEFGPSCQAKGGGCNRRDPPLKHLSGLKGRAEGGGVLQGRAGGYHKTCTIPIHLAFRICGGDSGGGNRHTPYEAVEGQQSRGNVFFHSKSELLSKTSIEPSILRSKVRPSIEETTPQGGHLGQGLFFHFEICGQL